MNNDKEPRPDWESCIYCRGTNYVAPPYCTKEAPQRNSLGSWHYPDCKMALGSKCLGFQCHIEIKKTTVPFNIGSCLDVRPATPKPINIEDWPPDVQTQFQELKERMSKATGIPVENIVLMSRPLGTSSSKTPRKK